MLCPFVRHTPSLRAYLGQVFGPILFKPIIHKGKPMIMMPTFLFFLAIFLVFCFVVYKVLKSQNKQAQQQKEPTATVVHSDLDEHSDKPETPPGSDSPDGADKVVLTGSPETSGIAGTSATSEISQTPAPKASGNPSSDSAARNTDNALGADNAGTTGIADRIDRTDHAEQLDPAVMACTSAGRERSQLTEV